MINRPDDCAWFGAGGEAILQALRVIKRRYVFDGVVRLERIAVPVGRTISRGMQRGCAANPLAKMVLYYSTHLAVSLM